MILYIYSLACFLLPGTLWIISYRKKSKKLNNRIRHIIWSYIFMFYGFTAMHDAAGIGTIWDFFNEGITGGINLIPFSSVSARLYMLNILNVFMFMPLGFLLPFIWERYRSFIKVLGTGFMMSFLIEICQLFCSRATDVDDLIMNTSGALVGYLCWKMFRRIFTGAGAKSIELGKYEALVYLFGGMLGIVLLYNWRFIY